MKNLYFVCNDCDQYLSFAADKTNTKIKTDVGILLDTFKKDIIALVDSMCKKFCEEINQRVDSKLTALETWKKEIDDKTTELTESVDFTSSKYDDIQSKLKEITEKQNDNKLATQVESLYENNTELNDDMDTLSLKVDDLEQRLRSKTLEINGLPEKNNENLGELVGKLYEHVTGEKLDANHDLELLGRMPNTYSQRKNLKPRAIAIRFFDQRN